MAVRVGIVVPIYNAHPYLAQTLDSVLAQTEHDWTCVLVDDGSVDHSAAIAQRYVDRDARFALVRQVNAGVSAARQAGMSALARSISLVIFLDADDVWVPTALSRLLEAMQSAGAGAPDAPVAVHAIACFMDSSGAPIDSPLLRARLARLEYRDGRIVRASPGEPTTSRILATWPCIITPGVVLARREAIERAGGWNLGLCIGEDWELWHRLSLISPIAFVDEPLIQYRIHTASSSSNWRRRFKLAAARARVMNAPASTPAQRRYARSAFRAMYRRLGRERCVEGIKSIAGGHVAAGLKSAVGGAVNLALSLKPM